MSTSVLFRKEKAQKVGRPAGQKFVTILSAGAGHNVRVMGAAGQLWTLLPRLWHHKVRTCSPAIWAVEIEKESGAITVSLFKTEIIRSGIKADHVAKSKRRTCFRAHFDEKVTFSKLVIKRMRVGLFGVEWEVGNCKHVNEIISLWRSLRFQIKMPQNVSIFPNQILISG